MIRILSQMRKWRPQMLREIADQYAATEDFKSRPLDALIVSKGHHNKEPKRVWLQTKRNGLSHCSGDWKPECQQRHVASETSGRVPPYLFRLPAASGKPWHSLACNRFTPTSAFFITWPFPCVLLSYEAVFLQQHQLCWIMSPPC